MSAYRSRDQPYNTKTRNRKYGTHLTQTQEPVLLPSYQNASISTEKIIAQETVEDIRSLEEEYEDLHSAYKDLHYLLREQDETLSNISTNTKVANEKVKEGVRQLQIVC